MGIYVLGMHRSGTSAYARMVGRMVGYEPKDPEVKPTNERGQWEDLALRRANDRLLADAGCDWSAPSDDLAQSLVNRVRDHGQVHRMQSELAGLGSEPWIWKDPRNCLTLPAWRAVDSHPPFFTVTVRHPLEVARSLSSRNGFPLLYGVALWERYNRAIVEAIDGCSALFVSFGALMTDTSRALASTREWLERSGYAISDPDPSDHVAASLRHSAERDDVESLIRAGLSPAQADLYHRLLSLDGTATQVEARAILDQRETPSTSALLATRRQVLDSSRAIPSTPYRRLRLRAYRWARSTRARVGRVAFSRAG